MCDEGLWKCGKNVHFNIGSGTSFNRTSETPFEPLKEEQDDGMMNEMVVEKHTNAIYCNPSLGLTTKARACEGVGQEWSLGVTFHALGSVGECEGMNPHTPKWAPTLGIKVPMDSWIFREQSQGSKPIGLKSCSYHWKALGT